MLQNGNHKYFITTVRNTQLAKKRGHYIASFGYMALVVMIKVSKIANPIGDLIHNIVFNIIYLEVSVMRHLLFWCDLCHS